MKKSHAINLLAVLAVAAVVGGAAWYKSQQTSGQSGQKAAAPAGNDGFRPRLVDLGADKCNACKALAPILAELREEYKGRLDVEFIDVWKNPDAKAEHEIRVIPTQILYDVVGNEVWRHEGFISKEDLKALFAEKVGVK